MISLLSGLTPPPEEIAATTPLPPAPIGRITLEQSSTVIGDLLYEGNVFIDGRPVCDNGWDEKEALVVCR